MSYWSWEEHLEMEEQKAGNGLLKSSKDLYLSLQSEFPQTISERAWKWGRVE